MKFNGLCLEELREISNFISDELTLKSAVEHWNNRKFGHEIEPGVYAPVKFHEITFSQYQLKRVINDIRCDPLYLISKRLFNTLPCMCIRDWSPCEDVMFYIYITYCDVNGINIVESLAKFHFYTGRTVEAVICKMALQEYTHNMIRDFTVHELINLVYTTVNKTDKQTAISEVVNIFQNCQKEIDRELKRQFKITSGDLKLSSKVEVKESGFHVEDLVNKYNKLEHENVKEIPIVEDVPVDNIQIVENVSVDNTPVIEASFEIALKDPKLFREMMRKLIPSYSYNFDLIDNKSPISTVIRGIIYIFNDINNVVNKLDKYRYHISKFINSDKSDFTYVHNVILIMLNANMKTSDVASLLGCCVKSLRSYIKTQRQITPDFIKSQTLNSQLTPVEFEHIVLYCKTIVKSNKLHVLDAIYVASIRFDKLMCDIFDILNNRGLLVFNNISDDDCKSWLFLRTRTLKFQGYTKPTLNVELSISDDIDVVEETPVVVEETPVVVEETPVVVEETPVVVEETPVVVEEKVSIIDDYFEKMVNNLLDYKSINSISKFVKLVPGSYVLNILKQYLIPVLDPDIVKSKIMEDMLEIEDFQTSDHRDFTGIHQFLIHVIRHGVSYDKIANFLQLNTTDELLNYVNHNRSINLDFIRNPRIDMGLYPIERKFMLQYVKRVHVENRISVHHSIWVATKLFNYPTGDLLNLIFENQKDIDCEIYDGIVSFVKTIISQQFGRRKEPYPNKRCEAFLQYIILSQNTTLYQTEVCKIKGTVEIEETPEPVVEETPEPVVEETPEPVVEETPEPVVVPKLVSIDINNEPRIKMFREFRVHGCIYNDPPCLVNDLHVAFNAFSKQRNKDNIPITRDSFVHLLKKLGFPPKSDLDGKLYVENLAPFSNALITTSITITQKQGVMSELFPNLSTDAIKIIVQAMTEANINTDITMVQVGTGKVITFNPKTDEQLKAQNSE